MEVEGEDLAAGELLLEGDCTEADLAGVADVEGDVLGIDSGQVEFQHQVGAVLQQDRPYLDTKY